ncbi:MAG: response regulator [Methylobacteriaceae bacterium]|nr:response regulator [Methylobacteriaceae bacterium]
MPKASSISVLIADDQPSMRSLVRAGLEQIGFADVREARDGEEALRSVVAKPAHLVISDFNMPGLDGIGLLRSIRVHPPIAKTAFIMLTGRADVELLKRAKEFGVNNFVMKPFTVATLKERIEAVFGRLS